MKPVGGLQGKGIFLTDDINEIEEWNLEENPEKKVPPPFVVQRYIDNPLLIGGKKFDMRIYVLCTSYRPLNLYLNRGGFCRFTHHRYSNADIKDSSNFLKTPKFFFRNAFNQHLPPT